MADDGRLLVVLLAEDGQVRSHGSEELGHHGGDAAEVARAEDAAQACGEFLYLDEGRKIRRVEFDGLGVEDRINAALIEQIQVALHIAGIDCQVFPGAELQRVDEDANDGAVAMGQAVVDQAEMSLVQKSHRRHQADAQALAAPGLGLGLHRDDGADALQFRHSLAERANRRRGLRRNG